ncbi:hypothetical protein B0H19DRAFT_1380038 [Mycena capillaripes]|nr:hypothetical protein B0H19DRAFT_1380038 [Mycena capillaripes]
MEATMSTSADTIRTLHARQSPPHSPFQSPPDSPSLSASGSSVSSFPSVSSSFFFSSAAASPPHGPAPPPVEETLIIPSLTLPALLIRPKQAQGVPLTRLLVLGPPDVAAAALFVDNPDALDPSAWVYEDGFPVLRTSTEWREPNDRVDTDVIGDINGHDSNSNSRGTERSNVELVALGEDVHQLDIAAIEHRILAPFRSISALLAPPLLSSSHEEDLLSALLVGPEVPLYTALLVVLPSPPAPTTASDSSAPPSANDNDTAPSSLSSSSTSASALDSSVPSLAPAPNSSPNRSNSNSAHPPAPLYSEAEVDVPEKLRRLVPVLVLAPAPPESNSDSNEGHSRSSTNTDTSTDPDASADPDLDPNDTTIPIPPPPVPTIESGPKTEGETDGESPATARLPPQSPPRHKRPRHAERERTETCRYPSMHPPHTHTHATTGAPTSTSTYTPETLRRAMRPPAVRALRADAAKRFVGWWRAGGVDPHFEVVDRSEKASASADAPYQSLNPTPHANPHAYRPSPPSPPLHHTPTPPVRLHPSRGEKAPLGAHLGVSVPFPYTPAFPHAPGNNAYVYGPPPYAYPYAATHAHAHVDPLHLPSLLALAREVVRAWAGARRVVNEQEYGVSGGKGKGSGKGKWWAFVAGVVLGVGVGVWASAAVICDEDRRRDSLPPGSCFILPSLRSLAPLRLVTSPTPTIHPPSTPIHRHLESLRRRGRRTRGVAYGCAAGGGTPMTASVTASTDADPLHGKVVDRRITSLKQACTHAVSNRPR